jgi:hypothetical protein
VDVSDVQPASQTSIPAVRISTFPIDVAFINGLR